jgi:hypothetical protein
MMGYSEWPSWAKTTAGIVNFLVVSVCFFLWWPKNQRYRWVFLACASYLFLFWLFMHT